MRWVVGLSLVCLAGCNTTPVSQLSYPEVRAIAERITKQCYAEGGLSGSPGYQMCVRHYIQREHEMRAENRDRQARVGRAMAAASDDFARQQQTNAAIAAANRPVNCTSSMTPAGTVRTNCY